MAIISVAAEAVLEVVGQCARKGVKAVVIFSGGFSEVGPEGERLQQELREIARQGNMRLLGPNSLGLINPAHSVTASFAHVVNLDPASPRTVGFVTQSGAFGGLVYFEATQAGVGFSSFTSVGNEADTEFADVVAHLDHLFPRDDRWVHRHGSPGHGADHVIPAFVSPSLTVPVIEGRPALGTWQSIVLVDPSRDNHERRVRISFLPA